MTVNWMLCLCYLSSLAQVLPQVPPVAYAADGSTVIEVCAATDSPPTPPAAPALESGSKTDKGDASIITVAPADDASTEENHWRRVLACTLFAEQQSLSWVLSCGPGRFNLIDWEDRPNWDRLWWLARWPSPEECHFDPSIGFNIHWWAGPVQRDAHPAPNLPPRVYDLYIDLNWAQRWTDWLTTQVHVAPGLYTDFRTTPPDAFRVPGVAVAVLGMLPEVHLVGGVEYLQCNAIQILPVAGILWQPAERWELRLVFPEPKVAVELSAGQHLWGYAAGEYGGGRWTVKNEQGHSERVEYSDLRVMVGLECRDGFSGKLPMAKDNSASFLEIGYVFDRRLRFADGVNTFEPNAGWMIRFGVAW